MLKENVEVWKSAPENLVKMLDEAEKTQKFLAGYGPIISGGTRVKSGPACVPLFSTSLNLGAHPHRAPASGIDFRIVVFFTLSAPNCAGYNGDTQYSREKLVFLLYEEVQKDPKCTYDDKKFLLDLFTHFLIKSAEVGAMDTTFKLDDADGWEEKRDELIVAVEKRVTAEKELDEKIKALSMAKKECQGALSKYNAFGQSLLASTDIVSDAKLSKLREEMESKHRVHLSKCEAVVELRREVRS